MLHKCSFCFLNVLKRSHSKLSRLNLNVTVLLPSVLSSWIRGLHLYRARLWEILGHKETSKNGVQGFHWNGRFIRLSGCFRNRCPANLEDRCKENESGGEGGSLFLTHVNGPWIWNKVVTVVIEERVDLREPRSGTRAEEKTLQLTAETSSSLLQSSLLIDGTLPGNTSCLHVSCHIP